MTDRQEKATINEIRGGNHEHYRVLVERYHKGLVQHLFNIVHDGHTAEDLAQDAFIKAYEKLSQYDDTYAFSTWLYKIADNMAYRHVKKMNRTRSINELEEFIPDDKPSSSETTDKELERSAVQKAIGTLSREYRQVVTLYYWDDCSYDEIAMIIDKPIGTVRTWLFRAKDQLRKELHEKI